MQRPRRCFVTGSTGFIGRHLVRGLVQRGDYVRCLYRAEGQAETIRAMGGEPLQVDLFDPQALRSAVAGSDVIFHLAGLTKGIGAKSFFDVNVGGVQTVAQACARRETPPRLIFVSSLAAVGPSTTGEPVTEETPLQPVSCYGRSKAAAEQALRPFGDSLPATIVRPPIVLGEHDANGMFLFQGIARTGVHFVPTFRRHRVSIIHVDDLVTALLELATRGQSLSPTDASRGVYHVSGHEDPGYAELGRMIGRAVGRPRIWVVPVASPVLKIAAACNELCSRLRRKPQVLNWDKAREATVGPWLCSSEKIRKELGFRVTRSLQERLTQTAQWYSQQGYFRIRDPL